MNRISETKKESDGYDKRSSLRSAKRLDTTIASCNRSALQTHTPAREKRVRWQLPVWLWVDGFEFSTDSSVRAGLSPLVMLVFPTGDWLYINTATGNKGQWRSWVWIVSRTSCAFWDLSFFKLRNKCVLGGREVFEVLQQLYCFKY